MATPVSKAHICAGDLLFWAGDTPFSHAIQARTGSGYSHVAIAIPTWNGISQVWDCIEAVAIHGVRCRPIERYLRDYPTQRVDWFRLDAVASERWKVVRYCRDRIGDGYALPAQFAWSFGFLSPIRRLLGLRADIEPNRQFCSELVSAAFKDAGFGLPKEPAEMSPRDCAELPYVEFMDSIIAG